MVTAKTALFKAGAVILFCSLIFSVANYVSDAMASSHITTSLNSYQVTDLEASVQGDGNLLEVSGKIKNRGFKPLRGAAVIYLLDNSGAVVHGIEAEVNNGHRFNHGQSGTFEMSINISRFSNLQQVTVEFVEYSKGAL